jgi:ATP-dependent Clp protease ATP-binding subunit ClpX
MITKRRIGPEEDLCCSFCLKTGDEVAKLIAAPRNDLSQPPRAYICDECVAVCNSVLEDERWESDKNVPNNSSGTHSSEGAIQ